MNEDDYYHENRIVGVKAGSSIFKDATCFARVAEMIIPLTAQADQIFFVVSALKGETDKTIEEIAGAEFDVLNAALNGQMTPAAEKYNTPDIAARLVEPENHSVQQLTAALRARGIDAVGIQHGSSYPLFGRDNQQYLYATLDTNQRSMLYTDAQVIVVPGFGVRNQRGEIMCTGRGSSDLTLAQMGKLFGLLKIVYWKDTAGYLINPAQPKQGIYDSVSREVVRQEGAKVLDTRVLDTFRGPIRITGAGQLAGGTVILPYQSTQAQDLYHAAAK